MFERGPRPPWPCVSGVSSRLSQGPGVLALTYDAADMTSSEELIAEKFNAYFANFNIRVEADEVKIGAVRGIRAGRSDIGSIPMMRGRQASSSTRPIA